MIKNVVMQALIASFLYAMLIIIIHCEGEFMTIFDIVGDFDLKIKLYSLDESIIKIWKYKECICMIRMHRYLDVENCYVCHPILDDELNEKLNENYRMKHDVWSDWTQEIDCHGGITFSDHISVCHIMDKPFWIGFDYGHSGDYSIVNTDGHYTDISEKISECESVAQQLIVYLENA